MAHLRTQIRDLIKQNLETIIYNSQPINVFFDSPDFLQSSQLPAITILSNSESINIESIGFPKIQKRSYKIDISVVIKSNTDLQEKADDISTLLEKKISESKSALQLGGLVKNIYLTDIEFDLSNEQEKQQSVITYSYTIDYMTKENTPDVAF